MERRQSKNSLVMWVLLAALFSQNMVIPVMSESLEGVQDQKTFFFHHHPHFKSTPKCSPKSSPKSSPKDPSPGGNGGGGPKPTPSRPVPPDPHPPAVKPRPSTPVTPDHHKPHYFAGTCDYWRTHPHVIWGIFGFWGPTVSGVFGPACKSVCGHKLSLVQAMSNTRSDGIGSLYRQGTASLLNSMVDKRFPFTTQQVKDKFSAALVSDKAAAAQAQLFKQANEGRL